MGASATTGEYPGRTMEQQEAIPSEDGRPLYYCAGFRDERRAAAGLIDKEITFMNDGVARFCEDCPLTASDLPYVELEVSYQMEKVLSDEPVELTFRAEKGGDYMDIDTGHGWIELQVQDNRGQRVLIDPAEVKTMYLGTCEIKLG